MKFKVGDRVQKPSLHWGLGMTGTVVKVEGAQNEVVWSYPAYNTFTQMESDEFLELVEETVAVPRALLEDIGAMLCHNKFREHNALREAIGLLLEPK